MLSARLSPPPVEFEFRLSEWAASVRQTRLGIITASATFLLFVYSDVLFFGLSWETAALVALRLSVAGFGAIVLAAVGRRDQPPRPERFDTLVFAWTAWVGLLVAVILPATRPGAWIMHGFMVCSSIPAVYVLLPTTFIGGLVIGISMAVGYVVFIATTNPQLTYMQGVIVTFALITANVLGAVASRWLHLSRRASFLSERAVRRAEGNLNALVDAVPFPVALVGLGDRRLRRLNDAARALFGRDPDALLGRLGAEAPELFAVSAEGRPGPRELALVDGEHTRWVLASVQPIVHDGALSTVLSLVDITARKESEEALARAKRDADDASRAKSAFVATMSHEIRTPLHGVTSAVTLLERQGIEGPAREVLDGIRQSTREMLELVDGVLELARVESGGEASPPGPFEPRSLALAIRRSHSDPSAPERLVTRVDDAVPAWLVGSESRLRRVLSNLVGNALRHGDGGPVELSLDVAARDANGAIRLRCEVTNTGPEIPPEQRRVIFEPFVQLDTSGAGRRGFGLGLAICQREVAHLGGTIALERSEAPPLTRFIVEVPLFLGEAPAVPTMPEGPPPRAPRRALRLLVAEDDLVSRRLANALLSGSGHRVTMVANGLEAVKRAADGDFDAILMDMRLPGIDGVEATRRIRAAAGPIARVPILATTANAMLEDRERYFAAGVSAILTKPIDFDVLEARLAALVEPTEPPEPAEPAGRPLIDAALFRRYEAALGAGPMRELVALCVNEGGPTIAAIGAALARGEAPEVGRLSHRLASSAHSAALAGVGEAAATLELAARGDWAKAPEELRRLEAAWQATLAELSASGATAPAGAEAQVTTSTPMR